MAGQSGEQTERREHRLLQRFQALRQITSTIGAKPRDVHEIVQQTSAALKVLIEGARAVVFLLSDDGETLRPFLPSHLHPFVDKLRATTDISQLCLRLSDLPSPWCDALSSGQPYSSSDVIGLVCHAASAEIADIVAQNVAARGVAGFPLFSGGILRGVFFVALDQAEIDAEDLQVCVAVADLVAAALEGNAAAEQLRRQIENLARLFEITQAMISSMEPGELAATAARHLIQALDVGEVRVSLWDRQEDILRPVVSVYLDPQDQTLKLRPDPQACALKDMPAARQVLESHAPLHVLLSASAGTSPETLACWANYRLLILLPLVHQGECFGLIELGDARREQPLTAEQTNMAMVLAAQVAAMLRTAHLFAEAQRRAVQLQTAAEVSRHATSILDVESLLAQSAGLICQRFDLYYVGIFLIDESGRWAVLRAGSGEAGRQMVVAGHRLEVGGSSMIGMCTASGQARIALDVGKEAVRFNNPLLPLTRSEMALPLASRGRVIGAMSIQSTQPAAFSQEDIAVLQTMADQLANAIENARLHEDQRRQLIELSALYEIGRAISSVLDEKELVAVIHQQVSKFTDIYSFYVALWERATDTIRLPAVFEGDRTFYNLQASWSGLVGWVLRHGEPLLVNSIERAEGLPSDIRPVFVGEARPQSVIVVPLTVGERVIGALSVQSRAEYAYTRQDLDFFSAVASQVAVAVENSRLYERERRRATQAALLNRVAQQTNTTLMPEQLLPRVAQVIQQSFGYDSVILMLVDPGNEQLVLAGKAGAAAEPLPNDYCQSISQGIMGWVVRHGQPLLTNDTSREGRYYSPDPALYCAGSELAFPLKMGDMVIGVLDIQRKEVNGFDELDVATVETLAEQVSVALQNARLYAETRRRAEEMAALNAIAARLGQSLELQEVLEAAMEEVTRVLNVEASAISLVNEENGELVLQAQHGLRYSHLGMRVPLGEGLSGQVVRSGKTLIAGDITQEPRLAVRDFAREETRAMTLVPMHSHGKVVGILSAMSHSPHEFTPRDIALLEAIANQVGAMVQNARLYQELREHMADLEAAYARLQELDKMKDEMIQNISHEMRTPLTFVKGYVQLMLDNQLGELSEMQRSSLEIVARKAELLTRLIDDIITLQTLNTRMLKLEMVDLGMLVRDTMQVHQLDAAAADLAFQTDIPPDLPPVMVDPLRVRQVLDHLLSNAIKFSLDKGTIAVRLREEEACLRVEVADQGIGIPADQLERIFDRFYQVDGSAGRRFGGAGLGLSLVKLIVEAHGGRVWVESELRKGSTFYFTLPKTPVAPPGGSETPAL